jgi:hypothetical protein
MVEIARRLEVGTSAIGLAIRKKSAMVSGFGNSVLQKTRDLDGWDSKED